MCKDLSIYIHIPFCVKKCAYCDFVSAPPAPGQLEAYADALEAEIRLSAAYADNYNIKTVFIGGGTPSIYSPGAISRILGTLRDAFEKRRKGSYEPFEITVECNPGTISREKFTEYKDAGVNRLSIGLQSADEGELKALGRIHSCRDWEEGMALARECGFDNINADVIYGLYGQSASTFEDTLRKVISRGPEHISAYSLIIEEGTPFFEKYNRENMDEKELDAWEEEERKMAALANRILPENGYARYEISNYAKKGCECRHNMVYWNRGDYLGFGVSAASLIGNARFANTDSLDGYLKSPYGNLKSREELDAGGEMSETAFLALRTARGISAKDFYDRFGKDVYGVFGDAIDKWTSLGMLKDEGGRICCTDSGFDISNMIMADFIL